MANDLHITRARDWTRNEGREITEEEWRACVESDPELRTDPENGPNAALWTAHPRRPDGAWLDWSTGNVYTTDADSPLLGKMLRLAEQLDARVVDDENQPL